MMSLGSIGSMFWSFYYFFFSQKEEENESKRINAIERSFSFFPETWMSYYVYSYCRNFKSNI